MHLSDFFAEHGIHHQTSCVGTSQQNGRVECKHRHILNVGRALRFQAFLPIEFWGECVLTTCYLINRTPSVLLDGQTPYERLFGKAPSYANIRSFGCLAYAYNRDHRGDKFASRSRRYIFMGYPFGKKGWYLYDLESASFFTSRDVTFVEHDFPYKALTELAATATPAPKPDEPGGIEAVETSLQQQPALGRHLRQRQQLIKLKDYVLHTVKHLSPSSRPSSCSHIQSFSAGSPYPILDYVNCNNFSARHCAFLAAITVGVEPASFAEDVRDPRWREAMKYELQAQENNNTWTAVSLPLGKCAIGCKWVYRIKYNADGIGSFIRWMFTMLSYTVSLMKKFTCACCLVSPQTNLECGFEVLRLCSIKLGLFSFTLHRDNIHLLVLVYVDDIIISGNNSKAIQRKYVLDIISEAGLLGAKPAPFPLEPNHQLALAEGLYFSDPAKYRRLPRERHWEAALRVVRYLKGNPGQGVFLRSYCDLQLYGWCDSDWASYPLSRRSLSGWFVMLGSSHISWKSKKQHTVARSSAEAEYRAMTTVTCELKWLKGLLMSLGVDHSRPMHLYCDSQAVLHLATNPVFHERTKHIKVDCHFV
ncbi:retrovirus-related pol polyprotein from transposon RE1 [Citrus sinensis]|uniref:Retrovirus-related pol polyprotein from transposon RE1 n=1 Tax=Citrus sinensis TaxID=2711 RepID=A0ACB8KJJ4_CITSI|nr:retrovirus-related pol polyprotein from transposon RE1 [Citrus sinensis]